MSENDVASPEILVTGATGFVGGRLVEALVRRGLRVACLVRPSSDIRELGRLPVRLIAGDLGDAGALREALRGIGIVYHLAGAIKAAERDAYFRINQAGTRLLAEAAAESAPGVTRFIHVSSLAAAGPSPEGRGLTESDAPRPISWYGESKLKSEQEVLKFAEAYRVTIVRPSAVYGPRDRETLLIFRMIKYGCLFTPGRAIRRFSLIHVDDLTNALMKAGEQDTPSGEVFYASRPEIYTWDEVGDAIARAMGRNFRRVAFPKWVAETAGTAGDLWSSLTGRSATINTQKVRELMAPSWICNPEKLWTRFELTPEVKLEEGTKMTVAWYRSHGWL